ncbi:MAG: class I SAM-dependent methyltransferase [Acidobacteriota bacterium]
MQHLDVRAISRRLLREPPLREALAELARGEGSTLGARALEPLITGRLCERTPDGPRLTRLGRGIAYHLSELRIQIEEGGAKQYVSRLDIRSDSRILDVGCGAGQSLVALSEQRPALTAGIDFDPVALALMAAVRDVEQLPTLFAVRANAERLPFADGSFDRIICRSVLMHVRVLPTLAEISRVCTEGGLVYLHLTDFWFYWRKLLRARWERGGVPFALLNGLLLQTLGRQLRMRATRTMSYQTVGSVRRTLMRYGFEILEVERHQQGVMGERHRQPKILARRRAASPSRGAEA